jgi:hypothetical protein
MFGTVHKFAYQFPAWSLDDVLLIPLVNPHGRKNVFDNAVSEGLSIFQHYRKEFRAGRIVTSGLEIQQDTMDPYTKVTRFVMTHFTAEERKRYFPLEPPAWKAEGAQ